MEVTVQPKITNIKTTNVQQNGKQFRTSRLSIDKISILRIFAGALRKHQTYHESYETCKLKK